MSDAYPTIDTQAIAKHFDAEVAEGRWATRWEEQGVYHYDPTRSREDTFVVDTPPPTVSGSLHVGHVFSYTHTDIIVRQRRMAGLNIFYPMGWDDNGLPTERRVQNHFHVRCDPNLAYEPGVRIEPASARDKKKPPRMLSRPNFIELCRTLTAEDEGAFLALWRRLGLSVDWRQEYATIGEHARRIAQLSFVDLHAKGFLYSHEAPTQWDVDFLTAVAQAELEDRELDSHFCDIAFGIEGTEDELVIATTRPELLPACVGVTAHPTDERYRHLFGKRAVTPLFRVPVPIFPSELAVPEKGTGILMVCTFGDQTDVQWWREERLPLRQVIGRTGRLLPIAFGTPGWESLRPDAAQQAYAELEGKRPEAARERVLELLADPEAGAMRQIAPLRNKRAIRHAVKFFEKGDRPLEFVSTRQWFCRLLDQKEKLLARGDEVRWHPEHMAERFRSWTANLQLDWCISRQRYFGVPFPVWYRLGEDGEPNYDAPIIADVRRLPIDPTVDVPDGMTEAERGRPGGFIAEADVFDTWFTSSMSPQISSHWQIDTERHARLFPADMRPQAHEIIRTWAFYTIAKAMAHHESIPWSDVVISGWVVQRPAAGSKVEKISKSKGGGGSNQPIPPPGELIAKFTADGTRYWAANARLGVDTVFDENMFSTGKRLVTKLFNASKFVLSQSADVGMITTELDRAFVHELRKVVESATLAFRAFEFAPALKDTESFFWGSFTDSYLELVKTRARSEVDPSGRTSAVSSLRLGLSVLLRLLAPVLPFITEEVWSWTFAAELDVPSIHRSAWPGPADFAPVNPPNDAGSFAVAAQALATLHRAKTTAGVGVGRGIESVRLLGRPMDLERLRVVLTDVLAAGRVEHCDLQPKEDIEIGTFMVESVTFAAKPDASV